MKIFNQKTILITGGTGSFGNAFLKRIIGSDASEIKIFSRDEKKQDDMRKHYANKKLKFIIGDVRDKHALLDATHDVDYIFHAAALKQVPSCEFYPMEAVKTNILGTENLLDAAIRSKVKKVICLSTDKAVYPINAMGISKSMMEKIMVAKSRISQSTKICGTRYGNVLASRGSVIPLFVNQINNNESLTITDPEMTRFIMTLDDAIDLVLYAFEHMNGGEIFVQKSPSSTIGDLADAVLNILGKENYPKDIIGTRHGEKKYEALLSREEMSHALDKGDYFIVPPDLRDLNYDKFIDTGDSIISLAEDYNSHNSSKLTIDQIMKILIKLPLFS